MSTTELMSAEDRRAALAQITDPQSFVQVTPQLTRLLGGDGNSSIMLSLIRYKTNPGWSHVHEHGGYHWWAVTTEDLAEASGMSVGQVGRTLRVLEAKGMLVAEKHRQGGGWDHRKSYRLVTERELDPPRSLATTDSSDSANRITESDESNHRIQEFQSSNPANVNPVKTQRQIHNSDSAAADELQVDKSGPFVLTEKRRKLVADVLVALGLGYAVPRVMAHLEMQTWGRAEKEIGWWVGILSAAKNGHTRNNINDLLSVAGINPISDDEWQRYLAAPPATGHGPGCHYDEFSGYCLEHGLRADGE